MVKWKTKEDLFLVNEVYKNGRAFPNSLQKDIFDILDQRVFGFYYASDFVWNDDDSFVAYDQSTYNQTEVGYCLDMDSEGANTTFIYELVQLLMLPFSGLLLKRRVATPNSKDAFAT